MKKVLILLSLIVVVVSCSKKEEILPPVAPGYIVENLESMPYYADTLLPEKFEKHNLTLKEPKKTIRPIKLKEISDSLLAQNEQNSIVIEGRPQESRGSGLTHNLRDYNKMIISKNEKYLNHHFVGMTSGSYKFKENNLYVEVIQFADEIKAYGYYASFRPHGIKTDKIGAESFQYVNGNKRYMVKTDYVVMTSVLGPTPVTDSLMKEYCIALDQAIIGSQATPPFFLLFPYASKIIPSGKFIPYQYLGIPGIDEVYTTSYMIGDDSLTLFLMMDLDGLKFKYLKQYARQHGEVVEGFNRFAFDSTFAIAFKDSTYGVIVAGIKSKKLIGTIQYNPKSADKHLSTWIKGL